MEKEAAIAIWTALEKLEYGTGEDDPETASVFNVRMDATSDELGQRFYRIRATATTPDISVDWWQEVLDSAREAKAAVLGFEIQNSGIELS